MVLGLRSWKWREMCAGGGGAALSFILPIAKQVAILVCAIRVGSTLDWQKT